MNEACRILGHAPRGVLVVSDHASARVPADIDLGIDPALLNQHIAIDIGVAEIGALLVERTGYAAFQGNVSRLVCDFNRDEHGPTIAPIASDGHAIPGNALDHDGYRARIARFYQPYHAALAALIDDMQPRLIVSLHSFTPCLAGAAPRPWHCGVLYNRDARAARAAIGALGDETALIVGDQQPYSGELLNATMNHHAEARGLMYFGLEIRQDLIAEANGQAQWAARIERVVDTICDRCK